MYETTTSMAVNSIYNYLQVKVSLYLSWSSGAQALQRTHKFNYLAAAALFQSFECVHSTYIRIALQTAAGYLGDTKQILDSSKSNDQMPSYG